MKPGSVSQPAWKGVDEWITLTCSQTARGRGSAVTEWQLQTHAPVGAKCRPLPMQVGKSEMLWKPGVVLLFNGWWPWHELKWSHLREVCVCGGVHVYVALHILWLCMFMSHCRRVWLTGCRTLTSLDATGGVGSACVTFLKSKKSWIPKWKIDLSF